MKDVLSKLQHFISSVTFEIRKPLHTQYIANKLIYTSTLWTGLWECRGRVLINIPVAVKVEIFIPGHSVEKGKL